MGTDCVRVIERARQTAQAVDMLLRGYRSQTICTELRMTRDRVTAIRKGLITEGFELPSHVRGTETTVSTIMSKSNGPLEAAVFCHEFVAHIGLAYHNQSIRTLRHSVADVNIAHQRYMRYMDSIGSLTSTRLKISDCWVIAHDLSANLILFYECKHCGSHRIVHEDQRVSSSDCPFCHGHS